MIIAMSPHRVPSGTGIDPEIEPSPLLALCMREILQPNAACYRTCLVRTSRGWCVILQPGGFNKFWVFPACFSFLVLPTTFTSVYLFHFAFWEIEIGFYPPTPELVFPLVFRLASSLVE